MMNFKNPFHKTTLTNNLDVRPWVRYWARIFDISLFTAVIGYPFGYLLGFVFPALANYAIINPKGVDAMVVIMMLFMWVFIEAFLLTTWGTTPGKWLLNVKVTNSTGETLNFGEAVNRSFLVWVKGLCIGLPFFSLITLALAHKKLTRDGITAWDKKGGFIVTHQKIGMPRIVIFIVLLLVMSMVSIIITQIYKNKLNQELLKATTKVVKPVSPRPVKKQASDTPSSRPQQTAKEEKLTSIESAITEGPDLYECREIAIKGKTQSLPILYTNLTHNCREAIRYQQVVYMGGGTLPCKGDVCKPQKQMISAENGKKSRAIRTSGENIQEADISDDPIRNLTKEIRNNPNDTSLYNNRGCEHAFKSDYKKAVNDFRVACENGLEIGCENLRTALRYSQ